VKGLRQIEECWKNIGSSELDAQGSGSGISHADMDSNELVRKVVPRDQLLEVKLEDGLGWEQICPFLECDIPSEPYPRQNMPDEFRKTAQGFFRKHWAETARRYAAVIVPLAGVAVWYFVARK
jgi:hypothetical protein